MIDLHEMWGSVHLLKQASYASYLHKGKDHFLVLKAEYVNIIFVVVFCD